jgi:hypothetical protein
LCPALLAAALPSVFGPPVELVAPLVRTMVRAALLSHCLGSLQRAAAQLTGGEAGFMSVCAELVVVVRELHLVYNTGLRYDASALSGSGM